MPWPRPSGTFEWGLFQMGAIQTEYRRDWLGSRPPIRINQATRFLDDQLYCKDKVQEHPVYENFEVRLSRMKSFQNWFQLSLSEVPRLHPLFQRIFQCVSNRLLSWNGRGSFSDQKVARLCVLRGQSGFIFSSLVPWFLRVIVLSSGCRSTGFPRRQGLRMWKSLRVSEQVSRMCGKRQQTFENQHQNLQIRSKDEKKDWSHHRLPTMHP